MQTLEGSPFPLGPSIKNDGINLSIVSDKEILLELIEPEPLKIKMARTGSISHIWIPLKEITYRYLVGKERVVDPYAPIIVTHGKKYEPVGRFSHSHFDWKGIKSPSRPIEELIIYEMLVSGYSKESLSKRAGTFLGILDNLEHLKSLGINAIELLPVHEFNPHEVLIKSPETKKKLTNVWGYSTVGFFALHQQYYLKDPINEFKEMVRGCHEAGIEVILDVVYNHTAEGNEKGPIYHFKILGNDTYYLTTNGGYQNQTGCGNTIHAGHPIVIDLIIDSLRYFVTEFHIDGFRFDLAASLNRDMGGQVNIPSALIEKIALDPVLKNTKMIAEPWDLESYQVGCFYPNAFRFSEWNGKYRDSVRSFIKGDPNAKNIFATRIGGSQDLYHQHGPAASINFITCHDGFTLNDLVSYNEKHNESNGEENRDGLNENISWNCGKEGPTDDPAINYLRLRQMKNFLLALFISRGIPMILMGDEVAATKNGNNNTWSREELNNFPWNKVNDSELLPYIKKVIALRKEFPIFSENKFFNNEDVIWHGFKPSTPTWDQDDRFIAYELPKEELYIAFNASNEEREVELPDGSWETVLYSGNELKADKVIKVEPFSSFVLRRV